MRPPTEGEVFANLGVELEYYGVAYLCFDCCAEVADFIQFVNPAKWQQTFDANINLIHKIDETRADLERAKRLLHARIDSIVSGEFDGDGASGVPVSETESEPTSLYQALNRGKSESGKSGSE